MLNSFPELNFSSAGMPWSVYRKPALPSSASAESAAMRWRPSRAAVSARLILIDDDKVCLTNINRQIIATTSTIGKYKVDVAEERIKSINPHAVVHTYKTFYMPDTAKEFDFSQYDYVIDAIDTVTGKLILVEQAEETHTPIISSMGAGNKLDPTAFEVTDINKTSVCPLAKVMRRELKKRGIKKLKVVYSKEKPLTRWMIRLSPAVPTVSARREPHAAVPPDGRFRGVSLLYRQ